jgi:hypothetical protein
LIHERKQEEKLQLLENPNKINEGNYTNTRRESSLRNKKREYLKYKDTGHERIRESYKA